MPPEQIDRTIQEILAREEFRGALDDEGREVEVIGELFRSILSAIDALIGNLRSEHPGVFLLTLGLGLGVLIVAIGLGARGVGWRRRSAQLSSPGLPEILRGDPALLRRQAQAEAQAGRWLEAVRLQFRAVVIEEALAEGTLLRLEDAERFRRARTYRELAAELAPRPRLDRARLLRVAGRLELGLYAGATLSESDWRDAEGLGGSA
ncbi:MAG: hypothetical protein IPG45_23125 [Deltaproteobacteria bacterium]|nr:hypothetical protein [Deltaproteobacteria bacterium]